MQKHRTRRKKLKLAGKKFRTSEASAENSSMGGGEKAIAKGREVTVKKITTTLIRKKRQSRSWETGDLKIKIQQRQNSVRQPKKPSQEKNKGERRASIRTCSERGLSPYRCLKSSKKEHPTRKRGSGNRGIRLGLPSLSHLKLARGRSENMG